MQMSERRRLSWRAEERKADFGLFEDSALEDLDFDLVFDPAWDGYAEETSLAFEYSFSPFRDDEPDCDKEHVLLEVGELGIVVGDLLIPRVDPVVLRVDPPDEAERSPISDHKLRRSSSSSRPGPPLD